MKGDATHHAFFWSKGKLTDLGTFGGDNSDTYWMNGAGQIVGSSDLPAPCAGCFPPHHPFLWQGGKLIDLGLPAGDKCGTAYGINSRQQIVGATSLCHAVHARAVLWEKGRAIDLNTQIAHPPSGLHLTYAVSINNRGDIAATGILPDGSARVALLVPRK
jgi:uncharacterized membrane protein